MKSEHGSGELPHSLPELMAQALAIELEATQRYTEFADMMEEHNNREVAALFRSLAQQESGHARQIMAGMGWQQPSDAPPLRRDGDALAAEPEAPLDDLHYLMRPWHALQLALAAEQRSERFFAELARAAADEAVRRAARELQAEEAEHVRLIEQWLEKVPRPDADWAHDPDPPRYTD